MSLPTVIVDGGGGTNQAACVNEIGELVTGRFDYDTVSNQTMETANTAVNFFGPLAGMQFVITSILIYANKNVGAGDATVTIYEATGATETAISRTIFTAEMVKQTRADFIGINLLINEGVFINGVTDDDDVFATVMGYYIPKLVNKDI
jgi:hypothetical protein